MLAGAVPIEPVGPEKLVELATGKDAEAGRLLAADGVLLLVRLLGSEAESAAVAETVTPVDEKLNTAEGKMPGEVGDVAPVP